MECPDQEVATFVTGAGTNRREPEVATYCQDSLAAETDIAFARLSEADQREAAKKFVAGSSCRSSSG